MFEILKEWLICKLGLNFCLSLSYDNIGEMFKDGVLFARLLHIYQVLPDQYIECFKKNNFYTVCLNNIKSINVWLQYLNIKIEDNVIQEIAHGKSPAVIYLLYQLYLKLEEKPCQVPDDINKKENVQFNNNVMTNSCKISSIQRNLRSKPKEKVWKKSSNLNTEKWNVLKLFCCLEGTQYTAIDILKSNKRIKGSILDFIQNNMNCFYNLLINNLNDKFFENEITDKSNQICRCIIVDNLNLTDGNNVSIDEFDSNNTKLINNLNLEININKQNILVTQLDSASQIVQNNKNVSDNLYLSREELKNENLMGSKINESSTTQGIDDHENIHFVKQNIFNEYTQHSGVWSNEYLNSEQFECKQHMLSMIVTEIINFDNSKTEIKCMDINKTSIAGVIDVMQNTTVVKLIKYILGTKRILNFTTNDAINACLDAYKKELEISLNKGELYQVLDNEQHAITKNQSNNLTLEKNSNSNKSENDSINSMPNITNTDSNNSSKSIDVTDDKLNILQHLSKITQTPEVIPEPDYKNPDYSPMANIGKTINEKITKNHDLQIGDVINCIGEFLKKNLGNNGWVLLEYPVQPLQMALLEYMLTGKIPCFGKELCNQNKKKSWIIPEYEDNNGIMYTSTNIYLSRCIKIIKRRDEIKNDKWNNFLQFYKQQDSIKVLISYLNDNIKDSRKAADILVGLILNEENYVFKTNKIFKLINIMIDNDDDNTSIQSDKDTDDKHNSERSLIITDENIDTIQTDQITNQFQLLNPSLSWIEGPLADSMYKALYLQNMWETMETSYIHKIKELLNSKKKLFEDIKLKKNVILKTVNEEIPISNNPSLLILLKNYENEKKKKEITKKLEHKKLLLQLQFDMWDQVDNDFEQIIQSVSHKVNDQWVVIQKNTLISIYEQLLEIELNRAITTLNFLRRYYDDNNTYHIVDFDVFTDFPKGIIDTNNKFKIFQIYCLDRINQFKNYVNENYEKTIIMINKNIWTQCVITEKNRFIDQVHRIKSGIILDETYLNDLTRIDNDLERIRTLYQIKINDVNHLFKIMECAIDAEQNINGLINQISGQFYINECSVLEIYCKQIFYSKENFNIKQLTTMVNTLLEIAPRYKISISDLIDTLSKLCKIHNIYPINWPIDDQFYNHFPKEILGDNITTIDWRDFVVQCMELPYPNIEEILSYRKLFQVYDVGDENITVESYETTKLWFENKSIRYDEAKWLLYDMYQDQNKLNYSAMLLAFCRDEQPWRGLLKAFGLIFDWIPYNLKTLSQHRLNDEKREIHSEDDVNSELSSNLSNEELTFDQNLMTSFLLSVLDLYINDKIMLGNIDIFQLVKSIFENVQPKQERETMIIDLFQNNEMNDLYGTVYKFQIRELAEVAKNIVMKYDLNI